MNNKQTFIESASNFNKFAEGGACKIKGCEEYRKQVVNV